MECVFITGMGRSGTRFLAHLLGRVPGVTARHEAIGDQEFQLLSWYLDRGVYAEPYLERARARLEARESGGLFVDVNSYLRNAVPAVRDVFAPRHVFHLVRDGRDVVRSIFARRSEKHTHRLPRTRAGVERWLDSDRFTQICINWASAVNQLLELDVPLLRFEDLLTDYDYLDRSLLRPCGFALPRDVWSAQVGQRVNRTRSKAYRWLYAKWKGKTFVPDELPHHSAWPDRYRRVFWEVCGDAMTRAGYERARAEESRTGGEPAVAR